MALPLVFEKYREASIFGPSDFLAYMQRSGLLKEHEKAPKAVILSYQRSLFDYVIKNHPVHFHDGYFKNHLAFLDETDGQIAIAGRFGIGAPAAAMMLEELIAFGAHSFISLGTAGGLVPGLHPGDLVLCTGALRDEGVSYHYIPGGGPALPDETMTSALEKNMQKAGVQPRKGLAWTIDALYRETRIEMDQHISRGAVVVEMEASALFTVARYREAKLASCFTISDSLAEPEWKPEFLAEETGSGLETLYHIALETLMQTL
ncbi:MAG: nucleoside phosphorylase [Spirochaetes bacterium]|nr:nucleoside phosphorylase [Spirochaetota bacterium]MBU0956942.1 nucleoside phosphorylase [Spirochaetota bacterium]